MISEALLAIVLLILRFWRQQSSRGEFKEVCSEMRALLDALEESNITDEEKNELLDKNIVRVLSGADRLRQ